MSRVTRIPVDDLRAGPLDLDAQTSRHVARVLRLAPGDALVLFDPEHALEATARVVSVERDGVRVVADAPTAARVRAVRQVTLLQAIGKGDKLDAIVRDATELGVTDIVPVETARAVVLLGDRAADRVARWRRIAIQAARQSGRGDAPRIHLPRSWADAVAGAVLEGTLALCAWEDAEAPIGPLLQGLRPEQPVVLAVGSEGGLTAAEAAEAAAAGFHLVSLGPFILRTETAPAAVLGALLLLTCE